MLVVFLAGIQSSSSSLSAANAFEGCLPEIDGFDPALSALLAPITGSGFDPEIDGSLGGSGFLIDSSSESSELSFSSELSLALFFFF